MNADQLALEISHVTKTFPGVTALSDVSLHVLPGEVHALVGENGAGKSTLMAIAAGALAPDADDRSAVVIGGEPLGGLHPTRARDLGLAIVYQHPALLPDLTVTENFLLGVPQEHRPAVHRAEDWTRACLQDCGAGAIEPRRRVESLNSGQRQLVEIARAIACRPSTLILDEPTEALTSNDIETLFANIRRLCDQGTAVVYISHRIPDVKLIADRVTLLRDGRTRGTFDASDISEEDIVELIVGRSIDAAFPEKSSRLDGDALLDVRGMSSDAFSDIDFHVKPGEIVGLAGIDGNGQTEFLRALAGVEGSTASQVRVRGRDRSIGSVSRARSAGIVYMPGDKLRDGLFVEESVRVNASVLSLPEVATAGIISKNREREAFAPVLSSLAVKTPSPETRIGTLSGGNQQKVVLARALSAQPDVLLVEDPTQGVDVGVRVQMYQFLREVADEGNGVVVLSSDALELAGLCDRVLIFSRGHIINELSGEEVTERAITQSALTSTALRTAAEGREPGRISRFLSTDIGPALILLAGVAAVVGYTSIQNPLFLGAFNLTSMLLLVATLMFVSYGQLAVVMTGGIDLSVGPLVGASTVVASFLLADGRGAVGIMIGLAAVLALAVGVGLLNAGLFRAGGLSPIIATLVTFTLLQGFGLMLRGTAGGSFDSTLTSLLTSQVGSIPIIVVVAVILAIVMEYGLRRTIFGIRLRALGSDEAISRKVGTNIARTTAVAYVISSVFAAFAALLVIASIGLGDASSGASYTFASVTAVILAGASISGGRGSVVATMLGAVLIQVVISATTFLGLAQYWQSYLTGAMMLLAAAAFAQLRRRA